jgi:prolyl 4-hydroxylase
MLEHLAREETFMAEYQNRTGLQWRHYFGPDGPRAPPVHHMWPAKEIGQKHHVTTDAGYWRCLNYAQADCQLPDPITFELEVISLRPKAFLVKNFFTEMEAEAIVAYAGPRMASSFVGNRDGGGARKSETRTSQNTWLPRGSFEITETLFHRAEQILNISRLDFHNTEDLQVVHYVDGQKYDAHHDWGVSGYPESRYITLLLYLNDMASIDAGGETSFPKGADGKGFKVHPGKGNAVFFYNLLEDGNGDDLSLHAALPVVKGEKWLANFWVWDPQRR